jgi:hypothetical protein
VIIVPVLEEIRYAGKNGSKYIEDHVQGDRLFMKEYGVQEVFNGHSKGIKRDHIEQQVHRVCMYQRSGYKTIILILPVDPIGPEQ